MLVRRYWSVKDLQPKDTTDCNLHVCVCDCHVPIHYLSCCTQLHCTVQQLSLNVSLIYNFNGTTAVNFIWISLRVFEIYCRTKGGVFSWRQCARVWMRRWGHVGWWCLLVVCVWGDGGTCWVMVFVGGLCVRRWGHVEWLCLLVVWLWTMLGVYCVCWGAIQCRRVRCAD